MIVYLETFMTKIILLNFYGNDREEEEFRAG